MDNGAIYRDTLVYLSFPVPIAIAAEKASCSLNQRLLSEQQQSIQTIKTPVPRFTLTFIREKLS
ncbi:hypothetical protein PGT21_008103 [Puccinia graminis f. sp. tritici]|uniref:Uncharacterized protein n=1 Tax=Puccinia graminis f. sp. tritici TaxID=56615 RepID=A0A5B0LP45_PUCGR|nr:hypothetical protein PGTUg99_008004 [Puccinia graminis f. sp. tritici]KAA1065703.1 hypothetical protein PGT21_008103 [Puccinia graminis f. sp. tritici]